MPRIDITLGLSPLDRDRRAGIWLNHIQDLFDEGQISATQSADLCTLAQQKWSTEDINGHQIKKTVKTARILAEKRGRILGAREVDTMLKMEREFGERGGYLDSKKEKKVGKEKDRDDLEGFEQVEKP